MPNQKYFDPREDFKMAQCDLSLSYPATKTEERFCKFAYSTWCPTCDKESPRRRSKSETNEPCRKRGREMKGISKKYEWNQEWENMDLEYEMKDVRYDSSRIRSNLCELPTTYITNNCQVMKVSSCSPDLSDITEKGIKCYENNLKPNEFNGQYQNLSSMVERQDRFSKLYPRIEETARNINGISKFSPKLDPLSPTNGITDCNSFYHESKTLRPAPKFLDTSKFKPFNGTSWQPYQSFSPSNNEVGNLEFRNRSLFTDYNEQGDHKLTLKPYRKICDEESLNSNLYYDTCTFFNQKVDVTNLKERYTREVENLKEKLSDLKKNTYSHKISSVRVQQDVYPNSRLLSTPVHQTNSIIGTVPKNSKHETVQVESIQNKNDRLKSSSSKVSLKTKGKLNSTKIRKQKIKISNNATNSDVLASDCSGSEDSDKLEECESLGLQSTVSSSKEIIPVKPIQFDVNCLKRWPLRHSIFPHIPPYLRFINHDSPNPLKIPNGGRFLKWKLSTITPILVRKTLVNSGFCLVRKSNEWLGTWGKHMRSPMFKTLKETQKLNHFPGTFQIGRKDRLWRNFQKLITKYGYREFGFIPQTYVLPQDLCLLKHHWQNRNGDGEEKYIIKPPASARGTGIKVINRWNQLPKRMSLVVQEYISNPYLINGSKFDLRLYVLVTSFNPLRIYLYPDGLVRFASVPYSGDVKDLKDRYMHLTNYSINKVSSMYVTNEDANACKGHKWYVEVNASFENPTSMIGNIMLIKLTRTLSKLWEYMTKEGIDTKALWKNLKQLVIKTIISGESTIVPLCRDNMNNRYNCYELFGIDILLDENLKAWLLEVNISPSLHSQSPLDEFVKGPLIKGVLNLAQFNLPPQLSKLESKVATYCFDPRLYGTMLSKRERNKHNYFAQAETREEYLGEILNDLTGDDVRFLTQAEDELNAMDKFERIFPTSHSHRFLNFMEVRYYNRLFDAWEHKYEKNRKPGIQILKSLCEQRIHLRVAPAPVVTKSIQKLNSAESNPRVPPIAKEKSTVPIVVDNVPFVIPSNIVTANKSAMDIKSLCNAIQSNRGKMVMSPFTCSDCTTHV